MKVANIFPVYNQKLYANENFVMILAHLLVKGIYDPKYFNRKGQYVILDNGLYEKQMVSNKLIDIINIAESSSIKVDEIVIPDVFHDGAETMNYFVDNLETISKWSYKYRFMFVAQGKNFKEFKKVMKWINDFTNAPFNLSIGIPKLSPFNRVGKRAIREYAKCKLPIHFLGITSTFKELLHVSRLVRSCDTSQVTYIVAHDIKYKDGIDIVNFVRTGSNVDLASAILDTKKLYDAIKESKRGLKIYGIL